MNREQRQEGAGAITPSHLLHAQHVGKAGWWHQSLDRNKSWCRGMSDDLQARYHCRTAQVGIAWPYVLQMASGETLPILKEALVEAAPTNYLGVHHQNSRRVCLGSGWFMTMTHPWIWDTSYDRAMKKFHCGAPGCGHSLPSIWRATEMVSTQCGSVMTSQLKGPQTAVDSLVGPGSRGIHWTRVYRVRIRSSTPKKCAC
jgi:hypothetical protein